MRYPADLPDYGTIGFIAPSFGCATEPYKSAFDNARKKLKAAGLKEQLGPNCYAGEGIGISNTPEKCAAELMGFYCNKENQALVTCGGGELMCEVLPHLDFEKLKQAEPKWFMGFSDITNFTFLSATILDTAAIYGPNAGAFGMEPWHKVVSDALEILQGKRSRVSNYDGWELEGLKDKEHPLLPYHITEPLKIRRFPDQDIRMEGRILGGCLDCLSNLVGTEYDKVKEFNERYRKDGVIWFIEACDLNLLSIRRALWQLKHAGWFDTAGGFLIGRPYSCFGAEEFGINQYSAVMDILADIGAPVLMDVDLGHLPPSMPMIVGSYARVENIKNSLNITFERK